MINLIKKLAREKISLTVEGNDLKLRFENGNDTLAPEIIKEIRDNKQALIAYLNKYDQRSEYAVIRQVEEMEDYPVSDGQRRMWVLHQINAASLAYHLSGEIVLEGTYSFPWFEKALKACIERHEILRTVFRENAQGDLRQVVLPAAASLFRFDYKDLEEASAEEVADYIRQDANAPFDLAKGPLLRAGLVRLAADRYIFHYTMHHIISDGWSMEILSGEILALYTAYASKTAPVLSPLLVQYKDFATSQLSQLESGALNGHREYWQQQLSGTLPSLELPVAATRPVVFTDNGYYLSTRIDPSLIDGLQRLCQQQNCSLFMGLIGVLNVLFYRYTGQGGAIIGTPVAGRKQAELENQIGFYLNTVALRTQFNGDESFLSLLQHIREITLGAFDHQSYPFDRLVDDLRLKRDTSRSALFDVMVVLQNQQQGKTGANLRQMSEDGMIEEGAVAVKLDLLFNFAEIANGMYMRVEFNSDIYDRSAISGLINHYKQLLALLVEEPGLSLYAHNYILEKEQHLLHSFNYTVVDYERGVTLPGLFRRQVALQPEATALVFENRGFTYRELDDVSGRLASYLHAHYTLSEEDLIGIKLPRSEWLIISLLAVLKAGCAYVPVDPAYPAERQQYIAEDSGYKVCIDDALLEAFREGVYSPECYHEVREDQLAYVLYTSGSSGLPKGCMLEHKGLINRLRWMWEHYGFTKEDVVLQKTTFTFDVSVWELFVPLCFGCKMILSSDEAVYSPAHLAALIRNHEVSRAHFVPVMLQRFIEEVDIASLTSLQHVFASGEALPAATVRAWYDQTGVPLSNLYGPTEASIEVSYYDALPGISKVPIGKPIANTHLHILDQYGQLVPVGIAGEVHIGGIQLARGYHHRPELTAEKFIDHTSLNERLYRTGDLGRWLSDGNIEYLGRIDDQVKVRGYRIELGEVEHALKALPGIAMAVVTAYKQSSGEHVLAAYYLSDATQDAVLLRQQLLQKLPEYMVPGHFTQLAALPLTPSGKVDRKALPAPEGGVSATYTAPRNATEAQLVSIWQEVLRTDTAFSITDDFFVQGGHSLKVMQLINHYARHFEVKVSVQDLFHHTTISAHASLLSTQLKTAYSAIQPVAPAPDYAVSDGQRRLWVLSQLEDSSRAYHLSGQMEMEGAFESPHLEAAINQLISRHEILRTVFREGAGGELRQVVLDPSAAVFKLDEAELENESEVPAYIAAYSGKVFDLGSFPLLRAGLIRLSSGRYIFHYTMHHIISDGWSMELLREEALSYYNSYVKGEESSLSPLRIQYKDFTAWQQQQVYSAHKSYWETQFAGELPVLELPGSRVRPAVKTYNGYMLSTGISPALTQGLQALCQQQQSTLFMGLLGVLKALFYRYTGQEDIIIGSPVAGREHAELEGQIGFYLNTVALRSRFSGGDNFLSLLSHIRTTTLAAYDHQSYPFDRLVDDLKLKRDTSRSTLFDVFVNVQNIATASEETTVLPSGQVSLLGPSPSKFDLIFNFHETAEGGLSVYAEFNSDIYDQWFVIRLLEHYQRLLSAVITQPHEALSHLDYLGEEEREQLLYEFNATAKDYGNDATVLDLFRESVTRYGDRTAITDGAATLSYKALDEQSDQVAASLQLRYGIRAGDLVGMRIPRSHRAITLMLGILKAGAGYVPVDMSNPEERTAFIVADSDCRLLVDEKILDDIYAGLSQQPAPSAVVSAESIAYVLYTSGTTGHPKGVLIAHRNLYNYLRYCLDTYFAETEQTYHVPLFTSLSFDLTVTSIYGSLLSGGELIIYDQEQHVGEVLQDIFYGSTRINFMKCTPAHIGLLEEGVTTISQVVVGGEALQPAHINRLHDINPSLVIYNEYGPTETTVGCTVSGIRKGDAAGGITIGVPVSNMQIYILDKEGQPVPAGITGEIYIGGAQVAQGYLNRPELTAAKFVTFAGQRVYRTGDVGRWLPDGQIDYLGRQDDQVKVRGYRIELGEIEHALQTLTDITSVVVVTYRKEEGEQAIAAYFTSEVTKDSIALRQQLLLKLPEYMVPAHFIQLPHLPLTANGKIDRNALPVPGEKVEDDNTQYVAPRNPIEISLVETCERIFKKTGISITTSFFDLGGDSIKAILLSSQMKQKGYTVKVGDVLKYPLLEELATQVQILDNNDAEQATVQGDIILMPVQQWFLSGSYDQKHHYNQSMMLSSRIPVVTNVLDQSLAHLVKHHDALRMVYRNEGKVWTQYNQGTEKPCYHLEEYDLREDADAPARMRAACNTLQSGINLEQGPLVKAGLFRLPAGDRLLLVIHHLIIDGVSWRILLEDLSTLYLQLSQGQRAQLPLKSDSFRDWAIHQQQQANGSVVARSQDYWTTLVNSSGSPLRKDLPEGTNSIGNSGSEGFSLDENITSLLQTKAHRVYHTDVNDILLTGLLHSVQDVFGQEHLLLTMEGHGREEIGNSVNIARTIGWFTSMYPVLLEAKTGEDAVHTLIRVKDHLRRVPDKGIGYGMLRYLHPDGEEALGTLRESDITFNYLGDFGSGFSAGGGESVFDYGEEGKGLESALSYEPESPLTVTAILTSGQLHVSIRYSKEQYYPETIARLNKHYADHLTSLIGLLSETEGSELTPGDLTYKALSGGELKTLNSTGDVTDIYTLSPLQGGLYYHWLSGASGTMYVEQMSYRLRGTFDLSILRMSYTYLTNRHAVLRTSFHHGYGEENIQVVHQHLKPDFRYQQLTGQQVAAYKIADREEGFNLHEGPAMRLTVLELGADEYEFVWTHHHILMDGWCAGVLINEFYQIYRQLIQGKTPLLSPVSPYVNYIRWLDVQDRRSSASYWESYLSGYEQQAVIPFGQDDGSGYEGAVVHLNLDKELVSGISNVCRSVGITENTFMQGAWSYLLGRYNNTEDVVFGAVVSGRPPGLAGVEHMIGLFINTIPVRVRYKGDMTARELLQSLQHDAINSLPHHYMKLSDIQSASLPGHQLFDHILVYENYPVEELVSDGLSGGFESDGLNTLSLESSEVVEQTNYDFTIVMAPAGASIQVLFRYNRRRYSAAAIQRISEHFNRVLAAFVNPAAIKLKELSYLGEQEKQTLLHTFNDTAVLYERNVTLPELFRRQVGVQPDATALVFEDRSFTYRELDEKSGRLASYLHAHYTLAPEDLIGIKLHRSEWLIISLLAVLKAGCAYVPVDPAYPEERQRYIAEDSGYKSCIDEALLASFNEEDYAADCYHAVKENQLAYVLYTSGSSGLPKGCMLEHKGLINRLRWMWEHYGFTTDDVVLQKTTFTFDVSVWELFVPLCFGCKMVLCEDEAVYSPVRLATLISTHRISNAHFVPVMLQSFMENVDVASLTSLKRAFASGEALPAATVAAWYAATNVPLYNLYGPTEASIEVSYYDTLPGIEKVPIGKPIANTHLHILDQYGQLAPVGIAAEIHIGGIQLARGYHHRPELTAEKFIDHAILNERLYRTGDLGRWLADGNIEYLGRIDDQVKIRGYRIELGEIEQALLGLPGINAAVVTAFKPDSGGQLLAAYYISETSPDAALLRQQLLLKLPEYMVPAYFTPLEHFPLTPSGKVNRKALPAPGGVAPDSYLAPRNPIEVSLTEICERMFKRKQVSIQASFLDLGGDSIKAILLASQLKQRGYSVKVGDVLKYPVLEELALHVHAEDSIITEQSAVEGDVALMPVQQWFLSGAYDHKHHYNQSVILSSRLPVDITVLDQSLAHLVKHHDALRMIFRYEDGGWQQYNQGTDMPGYHLEEYDLREHTDPEGHMEILCYGVQESIDLEQGALVKAGLFRLPAGDRLLLVIHHLVVDGVSWRILLEDLSTLYIQLGQGQRPHLPLKSDSFRDWAHHQQQQANSSALSGEWAYWTALTANSGEPLPLDMPSGANLIGCSTSEGFLLEENITHLLQTKAHRVYHTDINDILLSCLLQSVQDVFQQDRLLLTLEGHGREETGGSANISRTVGWFTSMYPVLLESMPGEDAEDTLIRVKDHLRRLPNKGIGYGMLRYLNSGGRERLGHLRPGDITFNYLGDFGSGVSSGEGDSVFDYGTENRGHETGMSYEQETALTVTGILVSGRLRVRIRYSKEQFHQETINRLSDCYANRLRSLITTLSEKDGSYLTAGDLTYKGLPFAALQELNSKKDVVDIYALSPLQEGLYYHWLSGTSRTMYVEQMSYRLHGSFDVEVLQQSYAYLVGRHAMLRTGFHHGYGKDNIQVVRRYNVPDFRYRELEEVKVAAYKITDREEGFNLHEGPGMRLTVLELKPGEYEFIWTHHHILMDGWCAGVLINEFYQIYRSLQRETTPVLAPVVPYVNYIRWLAEQDRHSSQSYWESYLSGYEQVAAIPFKKGDSEGYSGGEEKLVLSGEEVAGINSLCRSAGITENTFMQGVWSYLLGRYNNTEDVVFGAVVSGRPAGLAGVENMIGLFINTIPVRVQYEGSMTALELLQQLQQDAISSMPHHYVKLSDIQSRSVPGNRLFDHILVYENYPVEELVSDGLAASEQGAGLDDLSLQGSEVVEQTNYDFTVLVSPSSHGKGIQVLFRYNRTRFAEEDVQRISAHFRQLLTGFVSHANQPLKTLSYLTAAEQTVLLHTFNNTAVMYDHGDTLPGLFRRQVESQPDATALVFEDRSYTYRELDEWSGRLASYLHAHYTLSPEDLIGIKLHRSEWLIISLLAVLKSGCAYVPVDPAYPEERQRYIAEDSGYKACIDDALLATFREGAYSPDCYHEMREDQLAYVLYTSGSTGQPKGCMLEHKGLVNRLRWMWNHYGFTTGDVVLQKTTFTFDVSVWELFVPLCFGCKMVLCDDETVYSPLQLAALISAHEVSNAHFVPVMLQSFIEHAAIASLGSLKRVFTSGEALPVATVTAWYNQTAIPLYNLYGPTEASIEVSYYDTVPGIDKVPIGKPIANTHLHILDSYGQLAAVGIAGEIHIGGIQLARGYYHRPALTAEKFMVHPVLQERLYHTGDLGRWLPDGNIEYLGRQDDQVKIRGYRIELGEVEHAIRSLPGIGTAVVIIYEQRSGERSLAAYFSGDTPLDTAWMRQQLLLKLPEYMVPGYFTQIKHIPITSSGKVNRKALPAPEGSPADKAPYVAPRNKVEIKLVEIWKEVLGISTEIGINDNFFELGGHSIIAIRMLAGISKEFDVSMNIKKVFEAPTIEALAEKIVNENWITTDLQENEQYDEVTL